MKDKKKKIAIIGATSHIAKGLIFTLKNDNSIVLHLYARDLDKVQVFSNLIKYNNPILKSFSDIFYDQIDVIINCIGISFSKESESLGGNIFELTEQFDNLILKYLKQKPETTYINFSSGAIYGTSFDKPVCKSTKTIFNVSNIRLQDYYRLAKLNSEAKHRSLNYYNIVDLRIFGYFSRFIDLSKNYLMTQIISCIKEKRTLKTGTNNIIRDYIHPIDLSNIIKVCCENRSINTAMDVKSLKPINKMEILNYYRNRFGLKFEIVEDYIGLSKTGEKFNYYSLNNNMDVIKFKPKFTSIECIEWETEALFKLFN